MTAFKSVHPILPDADAAMLDAPCRKCQYNLRGLASDGRCPECGTPVAFSTQGDLIRYSDPAWIRSIRRGVIFSMIATAIGVVAMLLAFAFRGNQIAQIASSFIVELFFLIGAWLLTMPDPGGVGEDKYGRARRVIRFTLFVGLANHAVTFALQTSVWTPPARAALQMLGCVAAVVGVVGQFATLSYLSQLALRIPDDRIARRAHFLMYALGMSDAVFVVLKVWVLFARPRAWAAVVFGLISLLTILALVVFVMMDLIMLLKLQKRLKEQAVLAAQIWVS